MVTIIDYGAGNVFSVQTAIRRLNEEVIISSDPSVILEAERVIFPGVGQAAAAMGQDYSRTEGSGIGNLSGNAVDVYFFGGR